MQKLFAILWRLSIVLLPLQTRWIFIDGKIGNFAWEQGTVSFYVSWIPMILTVACAGWMKVMSHESRVTSGGESQMESHGVESHEVVKSEIVDEKGTEQSNTPAIKSVLFLKLAIALVLVASIFTSSLQATLIWWAYVLVIGTFAWALIAMRVSGRSISAWFVISVIPHAVYGIQQFISQSLPGCKYIGVAENQPWNKGTSVVEHGLYRVLRAYGGLPHPNILGGWIAVSLASLPELIRSARNKLAIYGWLGAGLVLATALVDTFSRGAWVAAGLAFGAASLIAFFASKERSDRQAVALLACVCAIAAGFGVVTQWDHVVARAQATEHLEMWSLLSRTESFVQGWRAFTLRPIAGWGPGAADLGIIEARKGTAWTVVPPEPPHAAPATFVVETGTFGILALIILAFGIWHLAFSERRHRVQHDRTSNAKLRTSLLSRLSTLDPRLPLVIALIAISLTDHYLVTLWPGIALLGISAAVMLARNKTT
jgi:hypothetical protein